MKTSKYHLTKETISILIIVLLVRGLLIDFSYIPSGSMEPGLLPGDYVVATRYNYGYSSYSIPLIPYKLFSGRIFAKMPKRGDIIIFRPPNLPGIRYIKRLVGLPGDRVQIINDVLHINDAPLPLKISIEQNYIQENLLSYTEKLENGLRYNVLLKPNNPQNTQEFYVPENHFFFLGDNRTNSRDSRFEMGFVPYDNLIAKAQFIYFSTPSVLFDNSIFYLSTWLKAVLKLWSHLMSIRVDRIFNSVYHLRAH